MLHIEAVAKPHLRRRLRQQHSTQIRREPKRAKADRSGGRARRRWRSEWTLWCDHQQRAKAASSDRSKQQPNRLLFIARREVHRRVSALSGRSAPIGETCSHCTA